MTKIKVTLDQIQTTINNLINKLDIANLGNWNTEKVEITNLLAYLRDKTQPKPTSLTNDVEIDLSEIEALETTLTDLTKENTRLTNENITLTTKTAEQDNIITGTTIPNLIANLEQYASKVTDNELKSSLAEITTVLTNLQQSHEEQAKKLTSQGNTNYWSMGAFICGGISMLILGYLAFFKNNKKEKSFDYE